MRFITEKTPYWTGFVSKITEKQMPNGGTLTVFTIKTTETWMDESQHPSYWFATLMGEARTANIDIPLLEGDRIKVVAWKDTNSSRQNEDGTNSPFYFNTAISKYEVLGHYDFDTKTYSDYSQPRDLTKIKGIIKKSKTKEEPKDPFAGLDD